MSPQVIPGSAPSESSRISQDLRASLFEDHAGSPFTIDDRRPRSQCVQSFVVNHILKAFRPFISSFQVRDVDTDTSSFSTSISPAHFVYPGNDNVYKQYIYDALFLNYFCSNSGHEIPLDDLSLLGDDTTPSQMLAPQQAPIYRGSQPFIPLSPPPITASNNLSQFPTLSPTLSATSYESSPASCGSFSPLPPAATEVGIHNMYSCGRMDQPGPVPAHPPVTFPRQTPAKNPNVPSFEQQNAPPPNASYSGPPSRSCAWGSCRAFVSGSAKGLRAHFKEAHRFNPAGRETVPCQWNGCNRTMQRENLVRHILSHHMRIKIRCHSCGKDLCRRDVETMHSRKFCPARK